jgi:hypothetical protein
MKVTIDIEAIAKRAAEYQENNGDFSYPFWMAFRDLYPSAGNAAWGKLASNKLVQTTQRRII